MKNIKTTTTTTTPKTTALTKSHLKTREAPPKSPSTIRKARIFLLKSPNLESLTSLLKLETPINLEERAVLVTSLLKDKLTFAVLRNPSKSAFQLKRLLDPPWWWNPNLLMYPSKSLINQSKSQHYKPQWRKSRATITHSTDLITGPVILKDKEPPMLQSTSQLTAKRVTLPIKKTPDKSFLNNNKKSQPQVQSSKLV